MLLGVPYIFSSAKGFLAQIILGNTALGRSVRIVLDCFNLGLYANVVAAPLESIPSAPMPIVQKTTIQIRRSLTDFFKNIPSTELKS
jgi:hypothetical protein